MKHLLSIPYFNSIKVQLKLTQFVTCVEVLEFQFHKGTIKTALC